MDTTMVAVLDAAVVIAALLYRASRQICDQIDATCAELCEKIDIACAELREQSDAMRRELGVPTDPDN